MTRKGLTDVLPLSPLQEGLLFHALYDERDADVYLVRFVLDLEGPVDAARLRAAAGGLLRRHPNLRAGFWQDGMKRAVQVIPREVDIPWSEHDLTATAPEDRQAAVERILDRDRTRRFDPARSPLIRFALLAFDTGVHRLVITHHHLLIDGWSMPLLLADLFALYDNGGDETALPPVPPFRDHLAWVAGRDTAAAEWAWSEELAGLTEGTIVARPDATGPTGPARQEYVELDVQTTAALVARGRRHGLTLNTLVQGAWGLVVGALTGRTDVTFGAVVSGRPAELPGSASMVGLFINTLPVRVAARPGETLAAALGRLQSAQARLIDHQHIGLSRIQRAAGIGELFDSLLVFENYPLDPGALDLHAGGMSLRGLDVSDSTHYPLSLVVIPGDKLRLRVEHRPERLTTQTAATVGPRVLTLLRSMAESLDRPVAEAPVLLPRERAALLRAANGVTRTVPRTTMPALLEAQAARTPDTTAVVFEDTTLTYRELSERANRLARLLVERGAGPETIVALALPRSAEQIVAFLAVLKAGAAYTPIDLSYPGERIRRLLADTAPAVVVTTAAEVHRLPPGTDPVILDDPACAARIAALDPTDLTDADRRAPLSPDHLVYVLYTSGSTGRPKGVLMPGGPLLNLLAWYADAFPSPAGTVSAQFSTMAFDPAPLEIISTLSLGKTLTVATDLARHDPVELLDWLERTGARHLYTTDTVVAALAEAAGAQGRDLPALLDIAQAGEPLTPGDDLKRLFRDAPGRKMHNLYGPAETHVVTGCSLDGDPDIWPRSAPIGTPVDNTQVYVLDAWLRLVPPGVPGELYAGGAMPGRGYLRRPASTAERFVADPFGAPGARLYRTGDLVRARPDGSLDFLGRADDQVKIGGQRVEPGEIQTVLEEHSEVERAVVIVHEHRPGARKLVAYVVAVPGATPDPAALRAHLATLLPSALVPAACVLVDALPRNANGKIDRQALPEPVIVGGATVRAALGDRELLLARLFEEVTGAVGVRADDSFFELGGDSIMSMQLAGRARKAGLVISPRDVFERRTVARLAEIAKEPGEQRPEPGLAGTGPFPSTPIMHWFRELGGPLDGFSQSVVLQVPADVDEKRLADVLRTVIDHHDALRLRVTTGPDGAWSPEILPPGAVDARERLRRVDARGLGHDALRDLVARESAAADRLLRPALGDVVRAVWCDAGDRPGRLILTAHHLAADGVTWRILLPDLAAAWEAVAAGRAPAPEPVGVSFRHWAHRLTELAATPALREQLPFWSGVVRPAEPLPADRPWDPSRDTAGTGRALTLELPAEITAPLLTAVPRTFHADMNDILLTALAAAVTDWRRARGSHATDLLVDVEGHGREESVGDFDVSRTAGWFTSLYPVRLDIGRTDHHELRNGGPALGRAVKRVKEQLRAIPDHGIGYGLLRHLNDDTAPELAGGARAQICFNYLGRFAEPEDTDWSPAPEAQLLGGSVDPATPFGRPLQLNSFTRDRPDGPRLTALWSWPGALWSDEAVTELAEGWFAMLRALVLHTGTGATGGRSPSDLPLVDLSQTDIDLFESDLDEEGEAAR